MWIADPFTDSGVGQATLAATGIVVAGGILWKPVRWAFRTIGHGIRGVYRFQRALSKFLEDWHGKGERHSVMDRLDTLESRTSQLVTNGGSSLHDKINRIMTITGEAATAASIAQDVGRHNEEMLEQQSAELLRHVEESHAREMTYIAILHEWGIDLDVPRADGTD